MRDAFTIRRDEAADSLVGFNCSKGILSREGMLTCGRDKGNEKNEVAAPPNFHCKAP
jgi:hypothetical protein